MLVFRILLYYVIFIISNGFSINYKTKSELNKNLNKISIDGLIYLTDFFEKILNNNKTSILKLYIQCFESKSNFVDYISSDLLNNTNSSVLNSYLKNILNFTNDTITYENEKNETENTEEFKSFIKNSSREYKIRWVINMENYQIKKNFTEAKFGGIVDYVNFIKNENLEEMIFNSTKENQMSRYTFEERILGLRYEMQHIINYISNEYSDNFLKQLYYRMYQYKINKGGTDFIYSKLKEILNYSTKSLRDIIQTEIYDSLKDLRDIQIFIDKIEYSGHRFIDFEEIVNNYDEEIEEEEEEEKGKDKIRKIAQYAETIHKKANNEKKSFSYLEEYVNMIPIQYLKKYIIEIMIEVPELTDTKKFKYIDNLDKINVISHIFSLLDKQPHDTILRMMINLYHLEEKNILNDDKFINEIFFYSKSEIRDYFVQKIYQYEYLQTVNLFRIKAEPHAIFPELFYRYRNNFGESTLKKWLKDLNEYKFQKSSIIRFEDIYLKKKEELLSDIDEILNLYKVNFRNFTVITKNKTEDNIYANFPDFLRVHSNEELRRFVYKLENYIKKYYNYKYIISKTIINVSYQETCLKFEDKDTIINIITNYQDLFPELKNYTIFFNIVGNNRFQNEISKLSEEEIRRYALKFYQYYGTKNYRLKLYTYEFFENGDFINYINRTEDLNSLKIFINRIAIVYPELTINGVLKEVLSTNDFKENITEDELVTYLETINNITTIRKITYDLLRYSNKTLNTKEKFNPENQTLTSLKVEIKKIFKNNPTLHNNWNFARLIGENFGLLYGGLTPLLRRIKPNQRALMCEYYYKTFPNEESIDKGNFSHLSESEQINYLENQYNLNKIKINNLLEIFNFRKMNLQGFSSLRRNQLIKYALLSEYYVRESNKLNEYGSIYNNLYTLSNNEMEDYINKTYPVVKHFIHSVNDFELYSHILGFDKRETNINNYSY